MTTSNPGLALAVRGRIEANIVPWVIAAATGIEYFDNAIFSVFAVHIAGGINASPDELVWASSAYAVAAVVGILQQQWWVERLGYARYISASLLLFAVASLCALTCESAGELAFARGAQGYLLGPMMSACRILLQVEFQPERRAPALRAFLSAILISNALGPLVGGSLVAFFGWRALFACTGLMAAFVAPFALLALPHTGRLDRQERGDAHFGPYLAFAVALGALQVVMQQVRFELFSASPGLLLMTLAGVAALAWFAWHQTRAERPLIQLQTLRQRTFQVGLVLYVLYYYTSNALSYLISRMLQGGLGYPVDDAGYFLGLTSLASIVMLHVYFRYSARITNKKWFIVTGFVLTVLVSAWLASMPPDTSRAWLVPPLVLRGMLLLFIAVPVANVTFRIFAVEEFKHSYRIKNMIKQLTYSFATATLIIFEQHRMALHWTRLAEAVTPADGQVQGALDSLSQALELQGRSSAEAHGLALGQIVHLAEQQAGYLSTLDGFLLILAIAMCGGAFAAWQRWIK